MDRLTNPTSLNEHLEKPIALSPDIAPQSLPVEEINRTEHIAYPEGRKKAFVDAYFASEMSAHRAGKLLGFTTRWGTKQINDPEVKVAIAERLRELQNASDEVIETLHAQMRADIGLFFNESNQFDLQQAKRLGLTRLIKRIKIRDIHANDENGRQLVGKEYDIELHNAQAAAIALAKFYGLEQKARENDVDIERKSAMYEAMIETVSREMEAFTGKPTERSLIIQKIAEVDPEIHSYILI